MPKTRRHSVVRGALCRKSVLALAVLPLLVVSACARRNHLHPGAHQVPGEVTLLLGSIENRAIEAYGKKEVTWSGQHVPGGDSPGIQGTLLTAKLCLEGNNGQGTKADEDPPPAYAFAQIRWTVNLLENRAMQALSGGTLSGSQVVDCLEAAEAGLQQIFEEAPWNSGDQCPWPHTSGPCKPPE